MSTPSPSAHRGQHSTKGNARFSPVTHNSVILTPTLYAGTTLDRALTETIFHDVPFKAGFKPFSKFKMECKVHSILLPTEDLRLIDLSTVALRKLGIKRTQLIDTTEAHYPATRRWAQALYTQFPAAQVRAGHLGRTTRHRRASSLALA